MSGGHFDYDQFKIELIADEVDRLIQSNDDNTFNEWGEPKGRHFKKEIITQFKIGLEALRQAQVYAHRIDYLVSGDDEEDGFLKRLYEDLAKQEQP